MPKITYYPAVLIPPLIQDFLDQEKVPDILQKKIEAPKPASIPNHSLPRLSLPLTAIIGIAAVSFAFGLGLLNFLQFILGLFLGLGWLLISINHYRKSISRFEQQQIAQKLRQQQYDRSVKEWEALHEGLAEFQEKWRLSRTASLKQLLIGKVMLPVATSTAQVGVSERFFLQYLTEYFVTETKQGESLQVIPGEELPIPGFDYNYSTDFSLVDPQSGLRIDVEIDEPYEGKTKKPHHCCDQGKDKRRN